MSTIIFYLFFRLTFVVNGVILSPMLLRPYQEQLENDIYASWNAGNRNVLAVLPTGGGKTIIFAHILKNHQGAACVIAHRQELVLQISQALACQNIKHRIIGPRPVVKIAVNNHMSGLGRSYYDPFASCAVAGVDTLTSIRRNHGRNRDLFPWSNSVTLWIQDETHHLLTSNKWGKAVAMFPNARGLGVTAVSARADGNGLGAHNDGVFHDLVVGSDMRSLINTGYLTDYRIFAPQSDINLGTVPISDVTGDYNQFRLKIAVKKSRIIGDVVEHYNKIASGMLGITFASDVEAAINIADQFNSAGVPAAMICAKTSDFDRISLLRKFKCRELLQLVNVNLFGEGFDLPAIQVVSFARPTQSYPVFVQQFGRGLRIMFNNQPKNYDQLTNEQRRAVIAASYKPTAIIIDHVGNVIRHGLPDAPRTWNLERRDKRAKPENNEIPLRGCPNCTSVYPRIYKICPWCGFTSIPTVRSGPEHVDGDLTELDAGVLAKMRGAIKRVDMHPEIYRSELAAKYVPIIGQMANVKRHVKRQDAQTALRSSMAWWAGLQRSLGRCDSESYRRFYFKFGTDVFTAKTFNVIEAGDLQKQIEDEMSKDGNRDTGK